MIYRDRTCRAEGCDIPGTWAEAHHWNPWAAGGRTDLAAVAAAWALNIPPELIGAGLRTFESNPKKTPY